MVQLQGARDAAGGKAPEGGAITDGSDANFLNVTRYRLLGAASSHAYNWHLEHEASCWCCCRSCCGSSRSRQEAAQRPHPHSQHPVCSLRRPPLPWRHRCAGTSTVQSSPLGYAFAWMLHYVWERFSSTSMSSLDPCSTLHSHYRASAVAPRTWKTDQTLLLCSCRSALWTARSWWTPPR